MKNKLTLLAGVMILSSCGGGGTAVTPTLAELQFPTNTPVSSSPIYGTKVIDGYVEGANVFVDFNFNLVQDEGEPSATYNSSNNEYEFLESQFSAVTNFTTNCGLNRPRVAEVPVGAWDSTRGYVNNAYTMMYFPHESATKANVTPFTTLLTDAINSRLTDTIPVAEGCDSTSNQLAIDIKEVVNTVLFNLTQNFGISRSYFYDDFIANNDTTQQAIGEKIVDFLTTLHNIEEVLKESYNMGFRGHLQQNVIALILNNDTFSDVTFSIQNETASTVSDAHFRYNRRHNFNNVRGNSLGQILDSNSLPISITLANLESVSDVLISENYEEVYGDQIISGKRIHISIEQKKGTNPYEKTFVRFVGSTTSLSYEVMNDNRSIVKSNDGYGFTLNIVNSSNPYFNDDIVQLMNNRNVYDLQQLHTDITAIDMSMSGVAGNLYLLYTDDVIMIEGGNSSIGAWMYRYGLVSQGVAEECINWHWTTRVQLERTYNTEAYNRCSEVL